MSEPEATEELEHLISIMLKDGTKIDFSRTEAKEVRACRDGHCVVLPHASGQVTLDFLALLEPLGKLEEETKEEEKEETDDD